MERVSGVLCSLGTSAGDFKFQTLHSTYFLSKFLATCRLRGSNPENRGGAGCCYGHVLSFRMCWTEHFWPLLSLLLLWLLLSSHVISFSLPLSPSLSLSLSLSVSFPPSVSRLVIFIVMLRIFDRKRMLLLICMSDSGFSTGYVPQPGGKLRYSPYLLFSYFNSLLFSLTFRYSHVSHTYFAKIAKQVPN